MNCSRRMMLCRNAVLALALVCPLVLTQCTTSSGNALVVSGDLATPDHSLPKDEYPFDEKGNYREEWVQSPRGVDNRNRNSTSSRSGSSSSGSRSSSSASTSSRQMYHTVTKGDTLWGLSRRYKVSVSSIQQANGLKTDMIKAGDTLKIP